MTPNVNEVCRYRFRDLIFSPVCKTECYIVFSKLLVHRRNQPRSITDFENAAPVLAGVGHESAQKNKARGSSGSFNRLMWVMKRLALTAKTK